MNNQFEEPPDIQPAADTTLVTALRPEVQPVAQKPRSDYYVEDNDEEDINGTGASSAYANPFQLSSAMPVIEIDDRQGTKQAQLSAVAPQTNRRFLKIALVLTVILVAFGFLWFTVFAQPAQPLTQPGTAATTPAHHAQPTPAPVPTPTPTTGPTGNWIPQQLPTGWVNAGLTTGDGIFAERTAWTFTDREEGIDFRNVGTQAQHGGTLTAATFLLSPGGRLRFTQGDVRVINNTLFDKVAQTQLVQAAVNAVPNLMKFTVQGQNQFAWVDVSYELFQSQLDPNNQGQRIEGLEMDTNQPRIHHMSVLLIRVAPASQGAAAPMGGSGWLVSNYGLDLPNPVDITQPI